MVVKLATLTQEIFFAVFPCFEKRSIPTFFVQKVLTLGATFQKKMRKFGDDIFGKNELKQFFPLFSMLNAIGEIGKVADFTTPCVNIANSAFTQLSMYQCINCIFSRIK